MIQKFSRSGPQGGGHRAVTEALRERIRSGAWPAGHAIPSRRQLAAEFGISPTTIERAIVPLLADGTLRAASRSATYVSGSPATGLGEGPGAVPGSAPGVDPHSAAAAGGEHGAGQLSGWPQSNNECGHGTHAPSPLASAAATSGGKVLPGTLRGLRNGPVAIVASLYSSDSRPQGQNDLWNREIVAGMENELAEQGHHTVFVNRVVRGSQNVVPLAESLSQAVDLGPLAGLAIIAFDLSTGEIEDAYTMLGRREFPMVSVVADELSLPVPHVLLDNRRAGFQAAHYLLGQGHRQLTVFLPERAHWAEERLDGVYAAVRRAGLRPEQVVVLRGDDRQWQYNTHPVDVAAQAFELAFQRGWTPCGPIICATDMVAMAVMRILGARGYTVGSQIPVLGFDDHEYSRDEGLTTLRPPMRAMGREAARLLLDDSENARNGCQVRVCSKLIPRRSTQPSVSSPSLLGTTHLGASSLPAHATAPPGVPAHAGG